MSVWLYDTAVRRVRPFTPVTPGKASIYLCGLTVQSVPHIGHLRSAVSYDVLRRWLVRSGLEVTLIRNVTDVDDRILERSRQSGVPFWALALANERVLAQHCGRLGLLSPTGEPRATGHILEMHELTSILIGQRNAYPAPDGSGDVYFDVSSFPEYGALSGRRGAHLVSEDGGGGKRDPRDFALWKGVTSAEPDNTSWASPWGRGRPGWHIECSAMSWRYLGTTFDIHGGGLDLVFPHHENEIAQSRAAGFPFARYWVHHGLLNMGAAKMSKSLGNVVDLPYLEQLGIQPAELRYYLSAPHYRSVIDYSEEYVQETAAAYRRIDKFVRQAAHTVGAAAPGSLPAAFAKAMDDDLNTPRAVACIHETVREGNRALASGDHVALSAALASVRAMTEVLGLDPLSATWSAGSGKLETHLQETIDQLVSLTLARRDAARARKDWATADQARAELRTVGILIEDGPNGTTWTLDG